MKFDISYEQLKKCFLFGEKFHDRRVEAAFTPRRVIRHVPDPKTGKTIAKVSFVPNTLEQIWFDEAVRLFCHMTNLEYSQVVMLMKRGGQASDVQTFFQNAAEKYRKIEADQRTQRQHEIVTMASTTLQSVEGWMKILWQRCLLTRSAAERAREGGPIHAKKEDPNWKPRPVKSKVDVALEAMRALQRKRRGQQAPIEYVNIDDYVKSEAEIAYS